MAARTVSVYRIQPDGQVGDPVWTLYKSNPNSICHAFTWQGDQLLFSQSDTKDGKSVNDSSQEEFEVLRNAPGKTFQFDPVTKVVKEILPTAYKVLAVNKSNNRLAAGTPVGTGKKGASLSFFDLGTNKLLGQWNEPKWEELGTPMPYLLDWSSESTGVFVVGPRVPPPGTTDTFPQPNLFYVSLEGKAKQVGHNYASMISGYEGMLPLGVAGENNTATVVTVNGNGFRGISRSNRERAERSYTWTSIQKIVLPAAKPWDLTPVAITPNARMVLVQVPKDAPPEAQITEADFWLIDFQDKRRRKLGTFPLVSHAYRWEGDRLIVALNKPDGDSNFGFFQLPEAVLPANSPQLQQILQTTPWEGAPEPTGPTVPTVAAQFLRQPDLVEIPAPDSWRRGPQPLTFVHNLATLSPVGSAQGDAVVGVNEKTMRVEYFRAPISSAAAQVPINPENAAKAAQTFARANFAALFAPGGTAQTRVAVPINERANYSVEVRRVEKGVLLPQHALVEVSASDGKIAGYSAPK